MQVAATDNTGVTWVSLYVDGAQLGTGYNAPYSFAWDSRKASNGAHTLEARAGDAAGNTSSSSISVTVSNTAADTIAPMVAITSPTDGARVSKALSVRCSASDNVQVVKVNLYVDGALAGTATPGALHHKLELPQG